jgi:predicted MPP superfamily phosphohydrolase
VEGATTVNWGFFLVRAAIVFSILALLFLSQRFWYRALWRVTANWKSTALRVVARALYVTALILIILSAMDGFRMAHGRVVPQGNMITIFAGLWFSSALFAYIAVKFVRGIDSVWRLVGRALRAKSESAAEKASSGAIGRKAISTSSGVELLQDPSRRYFFRTATAAAGAAPFLGAMYGFAAERLNYQIRRIEIPIHNLPSALDGLKIVQLSDIHLSGYMPRSQVRRAVDMANDLGADLAVITGDFITGASDPIADCIDELRRLYAPLGTWGCNGNHEIYARAEATAQTLFAQGGMKLLRQENAQISFKGAQFNLIGVDYQRERTSGGRRQQTLADAAHLVRRDMPNILLSHNPNSFNRAAELGIELSLAGHTHGGQIQVEILDHRLSPARFITDYIAGLYQRPLFLPARGDRALRGAAMPDDKSTLQHINSSATSRLYVNRGLGTVGAPVRLGVPPEISLIVLRTA